MLLVLEPINAKRRQNGRLMFTKVTMNFKHGAWFHFSLLSHLQGLYCFSFSHNLRALSPSLSPSGLSFLTSQISRLGYIFALTFWAILSLGSKNIIPNNTDWEIGHQGTRVSSMANKLPLTILETSFLPNYFPRKNIYSLWEIQV